MENTPTQPASQNTQTRPVSLRSFHEHVKVQMQGKKTSEGLQHQLELMRVNTQKWN